MSLFNSHFYHGLIRKYTIVMGSLLEGIDVVRYNADGSENHRAKVPLSYADKEKWVRRLMEETADMTRQPAITLPRMAFEMSDMTYDAARKLSSKRYFAFTSATSNDNKLKVMMPVPWNFDFNVYIATKTKEDMLQIIEQIVPFFTPDYTVAMKGIKNPAMSWDVPISLTGVNTSDSAQGGFEERRLIMWELSFTVRGFLFAPIKERGIIKTIDVSVFDYDELVKTPLARNYMIDIGVVPYIEGVPLADIGPDDPWGIQVTVDINQ